MAICGWVEVLSSGDSKFGIVECASGWWHWGVCIGKKMGWGLGLFFVVFIFKCVIFILLCLIF